MIRRVENCVLAVTLDGFVVGLSLFGMIGLIIVKSYSAIAIGIFLMMLIPLWIFRILSEVRYYKCIKKGKEGTGIITDIHHYRGMSRYKATRHFLVVEFTDSDGNECSCEVHAGGCLVNNLKIGEEVLLLIYGNLATMKDEGEASDEDEEAIF